MPQGIVGNNRAISKQIVEFYSQVWSGKETVKWGPAETTFIPG